MSGLLKKDWYCMRQYLKTLLFILVVWSVIFLPSQKHSTFLIPMFVMMGGIGTLNLFSYDHYAKWDTYMLSLPIKRSQIVLEKYLMALLFLLICGLGAIGLVLAAELVKGGLTSGLAAEAIISLVSGFTVALLYLDLTLPLVYWLGVEKARLLPAVIFAAFFLLFIYNSSSSRILKNISETQGIMLLAAAAVSAVLLMLVSWLISIRIYERKEF